MRKNWKKHNDYSIITRLVFIIILVGIILIISSVHNYKQFYKEKESSVEENVEDMNSQALEKIDGYLKDVSDITKMSISYRWQQESYINLIPDANADEKKRMIFSNVTRQMFRELMSYKTELDYCFIYNLEGNGEYRVKNAIYRMKNPSEEKWFQETIDLFGKPKIVDTYELPYVVNSENPIFVFGISRGIVKVETGSVVGVLQVNTNIDYFKKICDNIKITDNHRIMILHENNVIYDTNSENITHKVEEDIANLDFKNIKKIEQAEVNGTQMLVSTKLSDYSDWRIVSCIPKNELLNDINKISAEDLIFTIVVILITLLSLIAVSINIVKPIKRLEAIMKLAECGKFDIQVQVKSKDEIGSLSHSFNSMLKKIDSLIKEVYLEKINQSQLELQMLQAQINPHFLYNTLESISMMAVINDDMVTGDMAANLGSILRYGISNYNQEVTLSEEIENLKKYIELQEVRFSSIYTIDIKIEEKLYRLRILKMILQPIVENAVYHGMKETRSGGKIIVTAIVREDNTVEFKVSDNGMGMTKKEVEHLNEYIQGENQLFKSIGLKNVNKRIKLQYGDKYGVYVKSNIDKGTDVYIIIPTNDKRQ